MSLHRSSALVDRQPVASGSGQPAMWHGKIQQANMSGVAVLPCHASCMTCTTAAHASVVAQNTAASS